MIVAAETAAAVVVEDVDATEDVDVTVGAVAKVAETAAEDVDAMIEADAGVRKVRVAETDVDGLRDVVAETVAGDAAIVRDANAHRRPHDQRQSDFAHVVHIVTRCSTHCRKSSVRWHGSSYATVSRVFAP